MATLKTPFLVEWRPAALEQLIAIGLHIADHNPSRATTFINDLRLKCDVLATQPLIGRKARPGLTAGTREWVIHENYLVFYRVFPRSRRVELIAVRHVARRIGK